MGPPTCPPSDLGAHPCDVAANKKIETEDDVLHLKVLPSFDGALRPREAELLLQYLTVPYLRVPLLLRCVTGDRTRELSTC
jgi:hypothetical protein